MPSLTLHFKKRADATAQLILIREAGTYSAGAIGPADGYGPVHDITHFAIEQTLALGDAFLGLVASGWEIGDFEVKGTAHRIPEEAAFAEVAAGELSRQLLMRQVTGLDDFQWAIDLTMQQQRQGTLSRPRITGEQFAAIHDRIATEWQRWRELPPNGTLELIFTSGTRSKCLAPTPEERRAGRLATI